MIKAYHMVGSDEWSPEERAAALDEILSIGQILPASQRLDRSEMEVECFTGEERGSTIEQKFEKASPKALAALKEIAQEKLGELPESGVTHSLFNCLDLIVGDLDLVFLRPGGWYSQDNGFVFDAEKLLAKGAKFRPWDLLGDYNSAISVVVNQPYRSVKEAREEIEAMIDCVQGSSQYGGRSAIDIVKLAMQKKGIFKGKNTALMEIVWPGPLPIKIATEMWSDGKNVTPLLRRSS